MKLSQLLAQSGLDREVPIPKEGEEIRVLTYNLHWLVKAIMDELIYRSRLDSMTKEDKDNFLLSIDRADRG